MEKILLSNFKKLNVTLIFGNYFIIRMQNYIKIYPHKSNLSSIFQGIEKWNVFINNL